MSPPSAARRVRRPIILLGSGRSGTSLLGEIIAAHPDVAYWVEPRPVWMYRHAYRPHHALGAEDLTPAIARHIDGRFARFTERAGASRFAEKTPSNCLRIPFIHALYPDCRIVNIIRDGRAVVESTFRMQAGPRQMRRVGARLLETPLLEWPAYIPLFLQTVWRTKVLRKRSVFWGVRPPGWQSWLDLPPHVVAARQWREVVGASVRDGRALPECNYREIRFERLLADPVPVIEEVLEFCELPPADEVMAFAHGEIDPGFARSKSASRFTPEQLREIDEQLNPLLGELGYGGERD